MHDTTQLRIMYDSGDVEFFGGSLLVGLIGTCLGWMDSYEGTCK